MCSSTSRGGVCADWLKGWSWIKFITCSAGWKNLVGGTVDVKAEERFTHSHLSEAMNYVQEPSKPAFFGRGW